MHKKISHYSPFGDVSENYAKMEETYIYTGIARKGLIGKAVSVLCDAVGMADLTTSFLQRKPSLFEDNAPVPAEWYINSSV